MKKLILAILILFSTIGFGQTTIEHTMNFAWVDSDPRYIGGTIFVSDISGKILRECKIEDTQTLAYSSYDSPPGIYIIYIMFNGDIILSKKVYLN